MDSDKFNKLFEIMDTSAEQKDGAAEAEMCFYFKENFKPISTIFFEKFLNSEQIDIASEEIFKLISSSQDKNFPEQNSLVSISVVGFHHKKGTIVKLFLF